MSKWYDNFRTYNKYNSSYILPFLISLLFITMILLFVPYSPMKNYDISSDKITIIQFNTPKAVPTIRCKNYNKEFGIYQDIGDIIFGTMKRPLSIDINNFQSFINAQKVENYFNSLWKNRKNERNGGIDFPFAHKLRSEYQIEYNKIKSIIQLKRKKYTTLYLELLDFEKHVLQFIYNDRLLKNQIPGIIKNNVLEKEKIQLVERLSRLYNYCKRGDTDETVIRLKSLERIFSKIPDELKQYIRIF